MLRQPDFPDARRPDKRLGPVLVFVHPGAATGGPSSQILAQLALVRNWTGTLIVLEDGRSFPDTALPAMLRAIIDATVAVRDRAGSSCRVAPSGGLAAAVLRLLELAGGRRDFLITGAGRAIAETARLLEHAGARVRVHPSAVTYDEGAT